MIKIAVTSCGDHQIMEQTLVMIKSAILLASYDSVIHIDSDSIFLSPVEQLWQYFGHMNATQVLAMAPDNTNPSTSWYKNENTGAHRIPTPTLYSLNTGIILMNLTRMREIDFFGEMEPIVHKYGARIKWVVNDIMSIYLHRHPHRYLNLSCRWNYLTDHCDAGQVFCESAHTSGVALLHGSRGTFMAGTRAPAFRAVYLAFLYYEFNTDLQLNLVLPLKRNLMPNIMTALADYDLEDLMNPDLWLLPSNGLGPVNNTANYGLVIQVNTSNPNTGAPLVHTNAVGTGGAVIRNMTSHKKA
ncbi:unnamed protein product, partial [Oppiella nova]